jgi:hypothetical protein
MHKRKNKQVKHPSMAYLFGFVCTIGIVVMRIGMKQKRQGDIIIGVVIIIGALVIYFFEFY